MERTVTPARWNRRRMSEPVDGEELPRETAVLARSFWRSHNACERGSLAKTSVPAGAAAFPRVTPVGRTAGLLSPSRRHDRITGHVVCGRRETDSCDTRRTHPQ